MLYPVHLARVEFGLTTLVVIGTDCICSYRSNCHTIMTTTGRPFSFVIWLNSWKENVIIIEQPYAPHNRNMVSFMCMFCISLFVLFYFFFWPSCCRFFFDLRILTTPLISSNSNPAGTPGYGNGTESFCGLKGRPPVVRDVWIHNQPVLRMRRK